MLILKPRKNQGKTQKQPGQGWETVDENMGKKEGNFRKRTKIWPKGRKFDNCGIKNVEKEEILDIVDKIYPRAICKMVKNQAKKSRNAGCSLKKGRKGDRIAKNGHDKKPCLSMRFENDNRS